MTALWSGGRGGGGHVGALTEPDSSDSLGGAAVAVVEYMIEPSSSGAAGAGLSLLSPDSPRMVERGVSGAAANSFWGYRVPYPSAT